MRRRSVWVAWLISLILAWMLVACDPAGGSARNPTATLTPAASFTPLPSATSTHTPTQTASPIPSATPTTTPTFTPTATPTATSTRTPRPTARPATVSLSPAAQGIPGWGLGRSGSIAGCLVARAFSSSPSLSHKTIPITTIRSSLPTRAGIRSSSVLRSSSPTTLRSAIGT